MAKRRSRKLSTKEERRWRLSLAELNKFRSTQEGARTVTVIRDSYKQPLPELWMDVYIEGDSMEQKAFANMLVRARCKRALSPEDADVVIFTGGEDVNPLLYGERPHSSTSFNNKRDEVDMALYETCVSQGIPMFGVCRGAQFLHVMNGGKLYQDIDNHYGSHSMYDVKNRCVVNGVSSVHHQACIPNLEGGMEILAETSRAKKRWLNDTDSRHGAFLDVEAYFYRETCCLGVQGHPEYAGFEEFTVWTLNAINEYIIENPDIELRGRVRRIKKSILEERRNKIAKKLLEAN